MRTLLLAFWVLSLSAPTLLAQKNAPLIRSNQKVISIRDGRQYQKDYWTITPEAKPDVYATPTRSGKVTFYTDIDSISFKMKPGAEYNFVILLNGKDSAWTQVRYKEAYIDILRNAAKYNFNDTRTVPKFSYQSKDDPNLKALREGFKLDSIAGEGNDISKIINLLHWIHDLIPHDGQHGNPTVMNAMNMIAVCKNEHRGLNCRGLSTVLNECYLSMGFKSRYITCMPKDSVFDDCHVINMVWVEGLKKWIWIDATNNAYVMDEMGALLSIEEVRRRVIEGKPVILNPDANWNRKVSATKEDYLFNYMAKNLYRMECPVVSQYDTETPKPGKKIEYIELLPLDAYQQTPQREERTSSNGNTYITYKTNNPGLFWVAPF